MHPWQKVSKLLANFSSVVCVIPRIVHLSLASVFFLSFNKFIVRWLLLTAGELYDGFLHWTLLCSFSSVFSHQRSWFWKDHQPCTRKKEQVVGLRMSRLCYRYNIDIHCTIMKWIEFKHSYMHEMKAFLLWKSISWTYLSAAQVWIQINTLVSDTLITDLSTPNSSC